MCSSPSWQLSSIISLSSHGGISIHLHLTSVFIYPRGLGLGVELSETVMKEETLLLKRIIMGGSRKLQPKSSCERDLSMYVGKI